MTTKALEALTILNTMAEGYVGTIVENDKANKVWQKRDKAMRIIRSALSAPDAAIPDGWKIVPVEPTPEMMDSASNYALYEEPRNDGPDIWRVIEPQAIRETYAAMLSAAPIPAPPQGQTT